MLDLLFEGIDLGFPQIDLILFGLNCDLVLGVGVLQLGVAFADNLGHLFDLLHLSVINVGLPADLLMAILDFFRGLLQLLVCLAQSVLCLGKLNLYVAERVFEFLVLDFSKSEHLPVLVLGSLLGVDSEAATAQSCVAHFVLLKLVAPNTYLARF